MIKKIFSEINNLKLFYKLVLAFLLTLIVPGIISYSIATQNIKTVTNKQVHNELIYSVNITQTWVDDLFGRLSSAMIYTYESENVRELLRLENHESESENYKYKRLQTLNAVKSVNIPIINDIVSNNIYVTVLSPQEIDCINYTYSKEAKEKLSVYIDEKNNISQYILWEGFQENCFDNTNSYAINLVKYVFDDLSKDIIGVIILSIPEKSISQQLITEKDGHSRLLLDEDMIIIASSDSALIGKPLSSVCDYNGEFDENNGQVITVETTNDSTAMAYFNEIKGTNWTILELRDTSLFLEDVLKGNKKILWAILASAVVFFLLALVIARSISNPLRKLSSIMKNTDYYLNKFEYQGAGRNEVHILEQSFAKMKTNMLLLIEENKRKEISKREVELKALQAQINPHFLSNTLNSIRWTCLNNKSKKAAEMVYAFNNLLRMTIDKEDALISIQEEIENLGYYTTIMKMRRSMVFDMDVDIPDELLDYKIPRLMLQPLVENSIFHGFDSKKTGNLIKIIATIESNCIKIKVKDNGKGIVEDVSLENADNRKRFTGIGVSNVDERIKLNYGEQYGLSIESVANKGTTVTITLPIEHEE